MTRKTGAKHCARCGRNQPREKLMKEGSRYYCAVFLKTAYDTRVKGAAAHQVAA